MGAFACASAEETKNFWGRAGEGHELVFMISLVISWHNCLGTYNQPIFPFWAVWVSVTQRHPKCRAGEEGRKLRSGSWSPRLNKKPFPYVGHVLFICTKKLWSLKNWEYIGDHNFNRMYAQLLDFVVCDLWYLGGGSLRICTRPSGQQEGAGLC